MVPSNWRLSGREDPDTFRTLCQGWVQSILHLKLDKQLKRYFSQQEHPSPPFTDDTIQIFREELIEFFVQHGVQLVWTIRDHQPMHLLVLQQFSELMQDHFLHLINGVVTVFIMRSQNRSVCLTTIGKLIWKFRSQLTILIGTLQNRMLNSPNLLFKKRLTKVGFSNFTGLLKRHRSSGQAAYHWAN